MNPAIIEKGKRHSQNLTYLAVIIGIGIPILIEIVFASLPAFRTTFFEALFVIYSVTIPLGFIIFLYTFFLRQRSNSNKWYWWAVAVVWFLGAVFFFIGTFNWA